VCDGGEGGERVAEENTQPINLTTHHSPSVSQNRIYCTKAKYVAYSCWCSSPEFSSSSGSWSESSVWPIAALGSAWLIARRISITNS
jgi:hypothetical protein